MQKKILSFEGLRGFAAMSVVFYHFINFLKPKLFNFDFYIEKSDGSLILLLKKIIFFATYTFFDGKLAVILFWSLSSFVICAKLFQIHEPLNKDIIRSTTKRYFRLVFPCLISIIISFFLLKFHFYYSTSLGLLLVDGEQFRKLFDFEPNLVLMLKSAVWNTFFQFSGNQSYNTVLWTMEKELFGSFFCFSFIAVFRQNQRRIIFYPILILLFVALDYYWVISFILGMALADLLYSKDNSNFKANFDSIRFYFQKFNFLSLLLFIIILFIVKSLVIIFLPISFSYVDTFFGFIIVCFTLLHPKIDYFFSLKPLVWLGKHSFSIYLIHVPILCSLISFIYLKLLDTKWVELICLFVFLFTLFILTIPFTKYVDDKSIKYSNKIGNWFVR
jgi:peptidoglycan/LPS O-acetylase OafA/YrhL